MNIKKMFLIATMCAMSLRPVAALESKAEESPKATKAKPGITALIDNSITNRNMFFGMNFGDNVMSQLYAEINKGTEKSRMTYSFWSNFDTKTRQIVEIDQTIGYTKNIMINERENLSIQPALAYYTFPNGTMHDCQEAYIKAEYSGRINARIRFGKAFGRDSGKGHIISASISKTMNLTDRLSSTINLGGVYNSRYFAPDCQGISHFEGTISTSYAPSAHIGMNVSWTGQKRISKSFESLVRNESYWKMGMTYSF